MARNMGSSRSLMNDDAMCCTTKTATFSSAPYLFHQSDFGSESKEPISEDLVLFVLLLLLVMVRWVPGGVHTMVS